MAEGGQGSGKTVPRDPRDPRNQAHYYNKGQSATANYVPAPASQQARTHETDELGDRLASARQQNVSQPAQARLTRSQLLEASAREAAGTEGGAEPGVAPATANDDGDGALPPDALSIEERMAELAARAGLPLSDSRLSELANGGMAHSPLRPSDFPEGADEMEMDFERVMRDMGWNDERNYDDDDDDGLGLTEEEILQAKQLMAAKKKQQSSATSAMSVPSVDDDDDDDTSSSDEDDF